MQASNVMRMTDYFETKQDVTTALQPPIHQDSMLAHGIFGSSPNPVLPETLLQKKNAQVHRGRSAVGEKTGFVGKNKHRANLSVGKRGGRAGSI